MVSYLAETMPKGGYAFSPKIGNRLADFSTRPADFKIPSFAQRFGGKFGKRATAELGRRQARVCLESAVERTERLEAGIHGDRQYRHVFLAGIGESRLGFVDPIAVEKGVEIAMAETFVDDLAQPIFRQGHQHGERADGQPVAAQVICP